MSALLDASPRWPAALATTGVWALAAASLMFWGLKLAAPPESLAPPALAAAPVAVDPAEVAKLLGDTAPAVGTLSPEAGNRFVLQGVVADGDLRGAALIAVDGKAARPFRVGQPVGDYVLQSVDLRVATLGAGANTPPLLTLQLPKPSSASAGVSTPAASKPPAGNAVRFAPVIAPAGPR
jgi:general secretion pathway protein C